MVKAKELSEEKIKRHIEEMKEKIIKITGDPECLYLGGLKSLKAQESFLEQVLFMEGVEEKPLIEQLEAGGVHVPLPGDLADEHLHDKLWEVINAMALMGHYLTHTDHLSDRQLFEYLWSDILREPASICPDTSTVSCHIDVLGGCSDEDLRIRLKYYADEEERLDWQDEFPDFKMPPKNPRPYDRDRYLPVPPFGGPISEGIC